MLNGSSVDDNVQSTVGVDLISRTVKGECQNPGTAVFTEGWRKHGCQSSGKEGTYLDWV